MSKTKSLLFGAILIIFHETHAACKIDVFVQNIVERGRRYYREPLVTDGSFKFRYPSTDGLVEFANNEELYIGCPGGTLKAYGRIINEGKFVCAGQKGKTMLTSPTNKAVDFNYITCETPRFDNIANAIAAIPRKGGCHVHLKDRIDIGYTFLPEPLITVCFNRTGTINIPIYSKYTLSKSINNGKPTHRFPIFFDNSGYYHTPNLNNLYWFKQERRSLRGLLPQHVDDFSNEFLWNKGHLTANADFVYRFQRYATFEYVNVAPQWSEFNGGNWNELELAVRRAVVAENVDATVYTGAYDVVKIYRREEYRPLILTDDNNTVKVPIPKWFWKHVTSPALNNFVFFGWNFPFTTKENVDEEFEKLCGNRNETVEAILSFEDGAIPVIQPGVSVSNPEGHCPCNSGCIHNNEIVDCVPTPPPKFTHDPGELRVVQYVPDDVQKGLLYVCKVEDLRDDTDEGRLFRGIFLNLI